MHHYLFDWGDTLMVDQPGRPEPMCDWPEVQAVPNAVLALSQLTTFAKCHLATNAEASDQDQIRIALASVGLDNWIDRLFCFRSIGHRKPSAEFFGFVADSLSVAKSDMTMVGDGLEKDVLGAMQCGLNAIWYNPKRAAVPAGIVAIADLSELPSLAQRGHAPGASSRLL